MGKDTDVYELVCEICGKKIISLSESQADYNMKQHQLTHDYKNSTKSKQEKKNER